MWCGFFVIFKKRNWALFLKKPKGNEFDLELNQKYILK